MHSAISDLGPAREHVSAFPLGHAKHLSEDRRGRRRLIGRPENRRKRGGFCAIIQPAPGLLSPFPIKGPGVLLSPRLAEALSLSPNGRPAWAEIHVLQQITA